MEQVRIGDIVASTNGNKYKVIGLCGDTVAIACMCHTCLPKGIAYTTRESSSRLERTSLAEALSGVIWHIV